MERERRFSAITKMGNEQITLRESLKMFADFQERILQEHDPKYETCGWKHTDIDWLLNRMKEEVFELEEWIKKWTDNITSLDKCQNEIRRECADVANFAMMIFDNTRF